MLGFCGLPDALQAADASRIVMVKMTNHEQTGEASPVPVSPGAFSFFAGVEGANASDLLAASLAFPDGRSVALEREGPGDPLELEMDYDTLGALDAAVPDNPSEPYQIIVTTAHDGQKTVDLLLGGATFPNAPHLGEYTRLQQVDPSQSLEIVWAPFVGGTATDFIVVQIERVDLDDTVFATGLPGDPDALDGTQALVTVPAGTLGPGRTYALTVAFLKVADLNTSDYPGVQAYAVYAAETDTLLKTTGTPVGPEAARLSAFFTHNLGYMEPKTSGTVNAIMNPELNPRFFFNFAVRDTSFPGEVTLTCPPGSGIEPLTSTGFFQWDPAERIYVFPHLSIPPYPPGGDYTVAYKTEVLKLLLEDPEGGTRKVIAIPTLTVAGNGRLTRIDWVYQDTRGNDLPVPAYLQSVDIRINRATPSTSLYYGDNLPVSPPTHLLEEVVNWSEVMYLTFEMTDNKGNIYESAYQKALDPVITTRAIPEFPRYVPFSFGLDAFGGTPAYSWSIVGFKPTWLDLSPAGTLSSDSPSPMTFGLRVRVEDATGHSAEKDFRMHVFTPEAREVRYCSLHKRRVYRQTAPEPAAFPAAPSRYEFWAVVEGRDSVNVSNVTFQAMGEPQIELSKAQPTETTFKHVVTCADAALLDAAFPAGTTYLLHLNGTTDGPREVELDLPASDYPQVPFINVLAAAQTIDPHQGFALAFDPWTGGTTNDFMVARVLDAASGEEVAGWPDIFGNTSRDGTFRPSLQLNAGWLEPGRRYRAWVAFVKMAERVNGPDHAEYLGVPKGVAFESVTEFDIGAALTYEDWLDAHFTPEQQANPAIVGQDQDPDADGRMNLLEYALLGNPLAPDDASSLRCSLEAGQVVLEYSVPTGIVDCQCELKASTDLHTWSPLETVFSPSGIVRQTTFDDVARTQTQRVILDQVPQSAFVQLEVAQSN